MFPWVQQNQKPLSLKTNLIENDQNTLFVCEKTWNVFLTKFENKMKEQSSINFYVNFIFLFLQAFSKEEKKYVLFAILQ